MSTQRDGGREEDEDARLWPLLTANFDFGQFLDVELDHKGWAPKGGNPEGWSPEGWGAQNFALFFFPATIFIRDSHTTAPTTPNVHISRFRPSKKPAKFNERTPRERKKKENCGGRREKR